MKARQLEPARERVHDVHGEFAFACLPACACNAAKASLIAKASLVIARGRTVVVARPRMVSPDVRRRIRFPIATAVAVANLNRRADLRRFPRDVATRSRLVSGTGHTTCSSSSFVSDHDVGWPRCRA